MNPRSAWVSVAQFIGLGWYIAAAILAPTLSGVWIDRKAGTEPLFLLTGLLFGVIVAFYGTFKMASRFLTGSSANDNDERRG